MISRFNIKRDMPGGLISICEIHAAATVLGKWGLLIANWPSENEYQAQCDMFKVGLGGMESPERRAFFDA